MLERSTHPGELEAACNSGKKQAWPSEVCQQFGMNFDKQEHNLQDLSLFTDEAIIELLDTYPRRYLQCFTMGTDPGRPQDWRTVCIKNVSGKTLLDAVKRGRLWVNVTNICRFNEKYCDLITDTYTQIGSIASHIKNPNPRYNTLVLASRGTQFYFHISPEHNMVWNMRGAVTVSALPALDFRFVSQKLLEDIYAHEASGAIPYRPEFEASLQKINARSGECVWWPQAAPVRIEYHEFNVSLITSYFNADTYRREHVQLANRYLLRPFGAGKRSVDEHGMLSRLKQVTFRGIAKMVELRKAYDFTDSYTTSLRVNTKYPDCIERLNETVIPEFSKFYEDINHLNAANDA